MFERMTDNIFPVTPLPFGDPCSPLVFNFQGGCARTPPLEMAVGESVGEICHGPLQVVVARYVDVDTGWCRRNGLEPSSGEERRRNDGLTRRTIIAATHWGLARSTSC